MGLLLHFDNIVRMASLIFYTDVATKAIGLQWNKARMIESSRKQQRASVRYNSAQHMG